MKNFVIRSVRDIISDTISGENVIVCGVSALECLNLFSGYFESDTIDVYPLSEGTNKAISYHVVDSFAEIETTSCGSLMCTSLTICCQIMKALMKSHYWKLSAITIIYTVRHLKDLKYQATIFLYSIASSNLP